MNKSKQNKENSKIRQELLKQRETMPLLVWEEKSKLVSENVFIFLNQKSNIQKIFGFISFRKEPNLLFLYQKVTIPIAVPVVVSQTEMVFAKWQRHGKMVENRWGIKEPCQPLNIITADADTIILVPCLAVNKKGYRLGYGGGFYDRFLARNGNCQALGVVFQQFVESSQFQVFEHDSPLNGYISEKEITIF